MQFVAFLRAINVGGHTVKKETLSAAFAALGLREVLVFKQSGNVIFEDSPSEADTLSGRICGALSGLLGYEVAVLVRSVAELKALINRDPFHEFTEADASFLLTFLPAPVVFPLSLPTRIPNSTADIIHADNREIFSVTRGHGDGGKPNPFIEKTLKTQTTTRNYNIITQIVALCHPNPDPNM
jgi:uncharacterized protein (DUF1697 family)